MYITYTNWMGRPPRIGRSQVLATALGLADEYGLESLTMGAVAERLGVTPMALYRHVANKADLLDGVVELLLTEFPPPPPELSWSERLSTLAGNIRRSARRHPSVFPLLLQRPATTAEARVTREGVYAALADAGVPADRIAQVERVVSTAILGFAVSEAGGRFRNHSRRQLDTDFEVLQTLLGRFIESEISDDGYRTWVID
jgi:AcrR family transcriptional regulator